MIDTALPKAFVVMFSEISYWDVKSTSLSVTNKCYWPTLALKEVGSIDLTPISKNEIQDEKVKLLDRISFDAGKIFSSFRSNTKMTQYRAVPGDILISKINARKKAIGVVPDENDIGFTIHFRSVTPDKSKVNTIFLWLALRSRYCTNQFEIETGGQGKGEISEKKLSEILIPYPSLSIQQKIVGYWQEGQDEFQTIQNETERFAEEKFNELLKHCRLNVMESIPRKGAFGLSWLGIYRWDTFFYRKDFCDLEEQLESASCDELGNILNFISRPWSSKDFPDGTFEYIEISSVNKERGITGTRTVNVKKAPSRATTLVKKGDVILSTTRPYLGAFAIVPVEYDNCVCTSGFALADSLKTNKVDKKYLIYFLKSQTSLRQMERYMTGGLYPAIVQSELEKIKVPIPNIKVQREIVENIRKEEHQTNKKLTDAIRRFKQVKHNIEEMIVGGKDIEGVI